MPRTKSTTNQLTELKAENARLKKQLASAKETNAHARKLPWRGTLIGLMVGLAGALFIAGNMFFWIGHTLTDSNRYVATVSPLIKNPSIQQAVAQKTTDALFANINVEQLTTEALPPKAEFLAPTIASKIQDGAQAQAQKIVSSQKFQDIWISVNTKAHERLINYIKNYEGDGTINLQDLYNRLAGQLADTKLSFLSGKQLPPKFGDITIIDAPNLPKAHWLVVNLGWLRWLTITLFILLTAGVVWLARQRRKVVVRLGITYALISLVLLVSLRIARTIVIGKVQPQYQTAATEAWNIIWHSFVLQMAALLVVAVVMSIIAWLTGPNKRAAETRRVIQEVLAGKLHHVLFKKENKFTLFVARYRRPVEWILVALAGVSLLFITLKVATILALLACLLVLVFIVETLAAKSTK